MACDGNHLRLCRLPSCKECYNRSFASHSKAEYWVQSDITPREVFKNSYKKYLFKCGECYHEFDKRLSNITQNNRWCPYCTNQKLCNKDDCIVCFNKSFASQPYSKFWNIGNKTIPRLVFSTSAREYLFNCDSCNHMFSKKLDNIKKGSWCPYCAGQKLCSDEFCGFCWDKSFEYVLHRSGYWDFIKNYPITPRDVFRCTAKKYHFICEQKHTFCINLHNVYNGQWCPICRFKTQQKLLEWLQCQYPDYTIISEATFDWCVWEPTGKKCRYDFYIVELNLILELDGGQHFRQISNWNSVEETQAKDIFKMKQALNNKISIIRIDQEDILYNRMNWPKELMQAIQRYDSATVLYIGKNYEKHKAGMEPTN